jgi:CMP-N-acetylneuraminic acid synthetase
MSKKGRKKRRPRVLAITLARGGSKSVPRKNILPLLGVPLIGYTIAEAHRSQYITRYIVSTDDAEIARVASRLGAEVPFTRPASLATDTATSADALIHAVDFVERQEGKKYDYIVELMCTNPMKTAEDIDAIIAKLIKTKAYSVIGVVQLEEYHPARVKKIVNDRLVDFTVPETSSRRQDLKPPAYLRNGAIYAIKRDVLMVDGFRYGTKNSRPYIMPWEKSVNVDSEIDFMIARELIKKYPRAYLRAAKKGKRHAAKSKKKQ